MFRTHHLVTTVSLAVLLAGCGEDTAPPSGLVMEPTPARAARVSANAVDRFRVQVRQFAADAFFSSIDGCVETFWNVFGAEQTRKEGPGKPTTGPLAVVQVFVFNFCTGEILRDIFGETGDAAFQAGNKLTEARLEATVPAFDFQNGVEVQVIVDLAWSGVGELVSESSRFRLKGPGVLLTQWFKGTSRSAEVSGTVTVEGENVASGDIDGTIFRARSGFFELVRNR